MRRDLLLRIPGAAFRSFPEELRQTHPTFVEMQCLGGLEGPGTPLDLEIWLPPEGLTKAMGV